MTLRLFTFSVVFSGFSCVLLKPFHHWTSLQVSGVELVWHLSLLHRSLLHRTCCLILNYALWHYLISLWFCSPAPPPGTQNRACMPACPSVSIASCRYSIGFDLHLFMYIAWIGWGDFGPSVHKNSRRFSTFSITLLISKVKFTAMVRRGSK